MTPRVIGPDDMTGRVDWNALVDALIAGHQRERARIDDRLLRHGERSLLCRSAWIPGLGLGSKVVTIFPDNPRQTPPRPSVQGIFTVFDDATGSVTGLLDGGLVTWYKTAADSVLGARLMLRPNATRMLVIGAGPVAQSLLDAYSHCFAGLRRFTVWNRTPARAQALVAELAPGFRRRSLALDHSTDLAAAIGAADVIATATSSATPLLPGAAVRPGTHVDLVGAYAPDMREADDDLLRRASLYVDCRGTTIEHIGEIRLPLAAGVITPADIRGDYYDIAAAASVRTSDDEITVCKNGGGAHLDLMTAAHLLESI